MVKDPLKELNNMDWAQRNKHTEETFVRQTRPSIHDCLIDVSKMRRKNISDAMVPFVGRSSDFGRTVTAGDDDSLWLGDQFWSNNIQWSWDVLAGKIEIPF